MTYNDEPTPGQRRATQAIVDAYLNCLRARNEYSQAASGNFGDGAKQLLHQQLQNAVLSYFEALRYHLRSKSSVRDYWSEKTLWTRQQYHYDEEGRIVVDDRGQPVVKNVEVKGLQQLDEFQHTPTVTEQRVTNSFGSGAVEVSQPGQLPVDTLFHIARYLDEAAEQLGLLSEAKTPVAAPEEAEV